MIDHRDIDRRSLAFGHAIAAKIAKQPELISEARSTLLRWMQTCSPRAVSTLEEWRAILEGPVEQVVQVLTCDDERCTRLRQSSPFAGLLPAAERNAILLQFRSNDTATT
jgi:hypothetical protein